MTEWFSLIFLILLIIVPVGLLIWLAFFTDSFLVQNITVVDARPHTTERIEEIVSEVSGKNIFFIQSDLLEGAIQSEVPQVRTVHIARKLPATLKVIVQEKEPKLLVLSQANYYFVDQQGIAYEEASLDTLPGVVLPVVKNTSTEGELTVGTSVVDEEFVDFVQVVGEQLPEYVGSQVAEIRIPSLAAREVHFLLDSNIEARFDSTRSPLVQLSILEKLLENTITEEERANLEYVDTRIPNRVYYRTRGGAELESGASLPTFSPTPTPSADTE